MPCDGVFVCIFLCHGRQHRLLRCRCCVVASDLDALGGTCSICGSADYVPGSVFTGRTMMICDQCEQEYHVGCLKEHKGIDLKVACHSRWCAFLWATCCPSRLYHTFHLDRELLCLYL